MHAGSHILHRRIGGSLPVVARGSGVYIIDREGNSYLDASGGAAVSCLGHSHPRIIKAIKDQVDCIAFAHTGSFTSEPAESLADHLIQRAPPGINHVYFVSGGSEAVESALKIARQYFLEKGQQQRSKFIARRQSYHGNTLGALAVGGNLWRKQQFEPILIDSGHISPCYAYRDKAPFETAMEYGRRIADELDAKVRALGPENVIGFIAEPVVGATAGALVPVPGYFKRVREICDRHGILLILDEVMCGMGRTGSLFACEQDNVVPDIITIAKGLGAGYQPIGAMLCSAEIFAAIRDGSGFFQHGHTYMGHATGCAAALAVLETIDEEGLLQNTLTMGALLESALHERFDNHPNIGDIRGRGLLRGLEIVADRSTREPLDPDLAIHHSIKRHSMKQGLMCYPSGGTIDGRRGNHILLAPPFILEEQHVMEIVSKLADAVDSALKDVGVLK
ncbi:MAG: aspartate aminotransferase family protein [Halieaceae bacterium]|jgi:adenosylmethionine-8-amino-7-oxononanoate aminotransferase|nr:aspartate aminotransferase family protein [Halieaceae bacterium]